MIKHSFNPNWQDPGKLRLTSYNKARSERYAKARQDTPLIVANFEKAVEERRKKL